MIVFPNAKINLGLQVLEKRDDGFHSIQSILYPVQWRDILEILPSGDKGIMSMTLSGISIEGSPGSNICYHVYKMLSECYDIPGVRAHLHKNIPVGGGLGGGSSDAIGFLKALDTLFNLNIPGDRLHGFAQSLGSDCPFFLKNKPSMVTGRGEIVTPAEVDLGGYYLAVVVPPVRISTAWAFTQVSPHQSGSSPAETIRKPIAEWQGLLTNDFEKSVFRRYPEIKALKEQLIEKGALYASLSGSGSSLYGLYEQEPLLDLPAGVEVYIVHL